MADPYATNPYLQIPQEQSPNPWMVLANMATGIGSGISQGAASGQGWAAGLAPGIMMGNQLTGMQQQNAQQQAMKRWQLGMMAQDWQSKQEDRREKTATAKAKEARDAALGGQIGTLMGLSAPQPGPQMGPDFTTAARPQVDYLTSRHGLSPVAAAGVVGNLYQESGFKPDAVGDNGTAYGMAQWRGDRQTGLVNFAKAQGKPPTDQNVQLDYLVSEMKGGDVGAQRAYAMLQTAKTPQEASTAMMHFFRPAGYTPANPTAGHGFQNRVQYAQALLPNGQPVAMGEGGPPGSPADVPPQNAIASLPAEVRSAIGLMAQTDPKAALQMTVQAIQNQKKEDVWTPLSPESAKMYMGQAYDQTKAMQRNRLTGEIKPIGGSLVTVNTGDKLMPGQKKVDEKFADQYIEFVSAGGFADSAKMLDQLKEVQTALKSGANLTGPIIGMQGDTLLSFTNPNAMAMRDAVFEVAQRNLRVVLGAQFTAKEGEQLIARTYNPRLSEQENAKRIDRLMDQIKTSMEAKIDSAKYFEEHGTLRGWKGKLPKISDFEPEPIPESKAKTDRPPISSFGREVPAQPSMTPTQRPPLSSFGGGR